VPKPEAAPREPDKRAVDSVLRAVDFAERSLGEDIGLSDMAEAACYSPFYFSRLFVQATGHAPYDYLMRRRAAAAAEEIATGTASVVDVALAYGFGSPDTFARAFRRCFGLLPSEARRAGTYPRAVARTRISRGYVEGALARPFGPPSETIADAVRLDAVRLDDAGPAGGERRFDVAQRDGNLKALDAFSGIAFQAAGRPAPAFPARSTVLPAGRRAVFPVHGGTRAPGPNARVRLPRLAPAVGLLPGAGFRRSGMGRGGGDRPLARPRPLIRRLPVFPAETAVRR
jgi:AraC-like DNA-binding protein